MNTLIPVPNSGTYGESVNIINGNFTKVQEVVTRLENAAIKDVGYYQTLAALQNKYPEPVQAGLTAKVLDTTVTPNVYKIYDVVDSAWHNTGVVDTHNVSTNFSVTHDMYANDADKALASDALKFDDAPVDGSTKIPKSGGVKAALDTAVSNMSAQVASMAQQSQQIVNNAIESTEEMVESTNNQTRQIVNNAIQELQGGIEQRILAQNQEQFNAAVASVIPIEIAGDVTNAPDEEDLTSVNQGGTDVLKLKDKLYSPITYSGMGRVYLRKNMVNGVNTLTQDMFYKGEVGSRVPNENTIFVIQYDYTLAEDITIPAGSVLRFDGGSISGAYTLTGALTVISANPCNIFGTNVIFAGSWATDECYGEWFGAVGDGVTDDTTALQKALNFCAYQGLTLKLLMKKYRITDTLGIIASNMMPVPSIVGMNPLGDNPRLYINTGKSSVILYAGAGDRPALAINNHGSKNGMSMHGGVMRDFTIYREQIRPEDTSIGLKMFFCISYRLYNISIAGFNIGFNNVYGWSWVANGLCCTDNYVGIRLDDNSNACMLLGTQAHQNSTGIEIKGGIGITIKDAVIEGQNVGICVDYNTPEHSMVSIENCYGEQNRLNDIILGGNYTLVGNVFTRTSSTQYAQNVVIKGLSSFSDSYVERGDKCPVYIDKASNVLLDTIAYGGLASTYLTTNNARTVHLINHSSYFGVDRDAPHEIGVHAQKNYVINGFNELNITRTALKHNYSSMRGEFVTIDGIKYAKYLLPANTNSIIYVQRIDVKKIIGVINTTRFIYGGKGFVDEGASAGVFVFNSSFSGLSGNTGSASLKTTNQYVGKYILAGGFINEEFFYIALTGSNTTGTDKYAYLESVVFTEATTGDILFQDLSTYNVIDQNLNMTQEELNNPSAKTEIAATDYIELRDTNSIPYKINKEGFLKSLIGWNEFETKRVVSNRRITILLLKKEVRGSWCNLDVVMGSRNDGQVEKCCFHVYAITYYEKNKFNEITPLDGVTTREVVEYTYNNEVYYAVQITTGGYHSMELSVKGYSSLRDTLGSIVIDEANT